MPRIPPVRTDADLALIRNVGIVAHIDAGKTTLSERVLFFSGVERRMGEVHEGSTVLDWMPEERRRGITITLAAATVPWRGHRIQLIDTPGHVDFSVEVERAMRVLDGAVLVISALAGVQSQSEAVWSEADRHGVPTITFVNQLDRVGADFLGAVAEIERRLRERAVVLHYPLCEGADFDGFVDLVEGTAQRFVRGVPHPEPVPEHLVDEVGVLRSDLLDFASEWDDEVLALHVEGLPVESAMLRRALRRAVLARRGHLVLCGSAFRNIGVQHLLDAVVEFLPSPLERPPLVAKDGAGAKVDVHARLDGPACAFVFKVQRIGANELAFARGCSGRFERGSLAHVPRLAHDVRLERLLRVHADGGEDVDQLAAGEIVAVVGALGLSTGDTLCLRAHPLVLEGRAFSEPVLSQVVEPVAADAREALALALREMASEDPTLRVREDPATGQWVLSGMGELHLEVALRRLLEDYRVETRTSRPAVAYREAVRVAGRGDGAVERTVGGERAFGRIGVELVPEPDSGRFEVSWGCDAPRDHGLTRAIERAIERSGEVGPRFGFPLIHARAVVTEVDADVGSGAAEAAILQAAGLAMRGAMSRATCEILEPLVSFEIDAPAEHASAVLADLAMRRAKIASVGAEGDWRRVTGDVPLAQVAGYSTVVRSLSQGRARFAFHPAGFRPVSEADQRARGLLWT
jgi:elongation factor G